MIEAAQQRFECDYEFKPNEHIADAVMDVAAEHRMIADAFACEIDFG